MADLSRLINDVRATAQRIKAEALSQRTNYSSNTNASRTITLYNSSTGQACQCPGSGTGSGAGNGTGNGTGTNSGVGYYFPSPGQGFQQSDRNNSSERNPYYPPTTYPIVPIQSTYQDAYGKARSELDNISFGGPQYYAPRYNGYGYGNYGYAGGGGSYAGSYADSYGYGASSGAGGAYSGAGGYLDGGPGYYDDGYGYSNGGAGLGASIAFGGRDYGISGSLSSNGDQTGGALSYSQRLGKNSGFSVSLGGLLGS